jgi:ATP-dependent RNA circularization protein (DNA/RNA ligase family)
MKEFPRKPLGRKAYGSIPHLPGSRMGPGDHHIHEGQGSICQIKARDRHDRVIVTEKVDGSNVAIAKVGGEIHGLNRAGYDARTSPYAVHKRFADWLDDFVAKNGKEWLNEGEAVHLEWLAMAHGTIYKLDPEKHPLVVFDITREGKRLPFDQMMLKAKEIGFATAHVISDGPPMTIEEALAALGEKGFHGAQEEIEGAVWRVERKGSFEFMAKYVRPTKIDGKYLPELTGSDPIWMF